MADRPKEWTTRLVPAEELEATLNELDSRGLEIFDILPQSLDRVLVVARRKSTSGSFF